MEDKVRTYILENWDNTVRHSTQDDGTLIGLPFCYTVPCIKDSYNEIYYWDTYFTNVGLLLSGRTQLAENNVSDIAFLIERYGKMPNGNRTFYLNQSQPPFFALMVREVFAVTGNREWLKKMVHALKTEYKFWMDKRTVFCGLARYYGDDGGKNDFHHNAEMMCRRFGINVPAEETVARAYAESFRCFCECGWDCNSRFGMRPQDYVWVDLNALLYAVEDALADFSKILMTAEEPFWRDAAEKRRKTMRELLWDESRGMFCDCNFLTGEKSDFVSAAVLYPLTVGLCSRTEAKKTVALLGRLEQEYGVACCEPRDDLMNLQWDYPQGWPCLQYMAVRGLLCYGYRQEAVRIAEKYCEIVRRNFDKTGDLWEKYNVVNGEVAVTKEYQTHHMMGWSAGAYLYCLSVTENS